MNELSQIIRQLEQQRSAIDKALTALRGTPAAAIPETEGTTGRRGRRPRKRRLSPEGRARIAEAARRRWAALKAAGGGAKRAGRKKSA